MLGLLLRLGCFLGLLFLLLLDLGHTALAFLGWSQGLGQQLCGKDLHLRLVNVLVQLLGHNLRNLRIHALQFPEALHAQTLGLLPVLVRLLGLALHHRTHHLLPQTLHLAQLLGHRRRLSALAASLLHLRLVLLAPLTQHGHLHRAQLDALLVGIFDAQQKGEVQPLGSQHPAHTRLAQRRLLRLHGQPRLVQVLGIDRLLGLQPGYKVRTLTHRTRQHLALQLLDLPTQRPLALLQLLLATAHVLI